LSQALTNTLDLEVVDSEDILKQLGVVRSGVYHLLLRGSLSVLEYEIKIATGNLGSVLLDY
jgi:hypothetical protein